MRIKQPTLAFSLALHVSLFLPSPSFAQGMRSIVLGPEAAGTVVLDSLKALYRIGDEEGPGMLEQGHAVVMAPTPGGGVLVFTSYSGDGPIQWFQDGRILRSFGRKGGGPGEYRRVSGLTVDPGTGDVWVHDGDRLVSFTEQGEPGGIVSAYQAGLGASESLFLPDGSLVVAGPGGTTGNMGFILHHFDFPSQTWTSHYPLFRDSVFLPTLDYRKWRRQLVLSLDGKIISVSDGYAIEVFDPTRDFALDTRIVRQPPGWPDDILQDDERRRRGNPFEPGYSVVDALVDPEGRLWVVSAVPEEDWEEELVEDPRSTAGKRYATIDRGMDTLVEIFDRSLEALLASYRIDPYVRFIVGPGKLAYYLGDLPYPQFEVASIPLGKEYR